jgi:cation diffusion facilitator family transporter
MSKEEHSTAHIIQSLAVNVIIAATKAVAAFFTHSGAMLAEALHSFSDCGNQILLLIGVRQARKPPDRSHPLGYGRAIYFWSFLVALMLFLGGGVFSIYEGIHKIKNPEPVERVWLGLVILFISIGLEGSACLSNVKEMNKRRGDVPFMKYLKDTKDSDLIVVFGENFAAVLGLTFAIAALVLAWKTGDGRWDGIGGVLIGAVLVGVAIFLATKVSSLLIGESADPVIDAEVRKIASEMKELERVLSLVTVQQGPGEVMVSIKVAFTSSMIIEDVCKTINRFEARIRKAMPEVRWIFVEPDIPFSQRVPELGDDLKDPPKEDAEEEENEKRAEA